MTQLLAIDTATEACSVALTTDSGIVERFEVAPRRHGELVLGMIEAVLAEAGISRSCLDAVAVGRGPGAFTGVRIGIAVAQAIAVALDRPVVPVSNLAALAHGCWRETGQARILAAIDARMGEIYAAGLEVGEHELVTCSAEVVIAPGRWRPPAGIWAGAGTGWRTYAEELASLDGVEIRHIEPDRLPSARDIGALGLRDLAAGLGIDPAQVLPVYLRDQVARKPAPR